jgi:hypothetical protein
MKRFVKWTGAFVLVIVAAMQVGLGPVTHAARPITARVVDAQTGEPIGEASVAAIFWIDVGLIESKEWIFAAQETTTATDGTFHLPGFGPKLRWPPWGHLSGEAPLMVVFKPGYKIWKHENQFASMEGPGLAGWVIRSQANGYVFQLEPVGADLQAEDAEKQAQCFLIRELMRGGCGWKRVPQLVASLMARDRLQATTGVTCGRRSLDEWSRALGCGALNLPESLA